MVWFDKKGLVLFFK